MISHRLHTAVQTSIALLMGFAAILHAQNPATRTLTDMDGDISLFRGVERDADVVHQGTASVRGDTHAENSSAVLKGIPNAWTGFDNLELWLHSGTANNADVMPESETRAPLPRLVAAIRATHIAHAGERWLRTTHPVDFLWRMHDNCAVVVADCSRATDAEIAVPPTAAVALDGRRTPLRPAGEGRSLLSLPAGRHEFRIER